MFEQVKIILIRTTHPGNVGAVARAMKNMGFRQLTLVSPKHFPSDEAVARASGAEDILENATLVETLEEAVSDCHLIMGLSARQRRRSWPTVSLREGALELADRAKADPTFKTGILFGQEQSGLLNEELAKCHIQINIPANPDFSSLNVAQAVQLMTYELRMAFLQDSPLAKSSDLVPATQDAVEAFYQHLEETLIDIRFLDPNAPGHLMVHLRRLFAKSMLSPTELNILRGVLKAVQKGYS